MRRYDSVQYLAHTDCEFKACNKHAGTHSLNYEIQSTRLKGMYSCTSKDGKSKLIKAGWKGAQDCACDNGPNILNCNAAASHVKPPIQPVKPPLGNC